MVEYCRLLVFELLILIKLDFSVGTAVKSSAFNPFWVEHRYVYTVYIKTEGSIFGHTLNKNNR